MARLACQANAHAPQLVSHDRYGRRIDLVEYHPAYHELMAEAFGRGLHALAWTATGEAAPFSARAVLCYLWNQGENGTACPMTMSFAARQVLDANPVLAAEWAPKLLAADYDPRPLPLGEKRAVTLGMAMTEKQGGSDLRANATQARPIGGEAYLLDGHKWFCSAPMSDAFLALARTAAGVTCFLAPRSLPDGSRNPFLIQRLKDKCGNRSNASAEVEFAGTWARRVGEDGRGIATLIEMAHLTRFDITVATAGMMRAALVQALHHAAHRSALGRRLSEQALMQNVLADLALEWEAALLLALRVAQAFDRARDDEREQRFARIATPAAKYWLCKRNPAFMAEAMECLGGNGYVEEHGLARLYREAPVNSIWEGSGNVICLDVLRAIARDPQSVGAVLEEIDEVARQDRRLAALQAGIERSLESGADLEGEARRLTERLALALQASLMLRHAPQPHADAFVASRFGDGGGHAFGTLPPGTPCRGIMERAWSNE
jgi:putative acyl-CoA dehydrogenase